MEISSISSFLARLKKRRGINYSVNYKISKLAVFNVNEYFFLSEFMKLRIFEDIQEKLKFQKKSLHLNRNSNFTLSTFGAVLSCTWPTVTVVSLVET